MYWSVHCPETSGLPRADPTAPGVTWAPGKARATLPPSPPQRGRAKLCRGAGGSSRVISPKSIFTVGSLCPQGSGSPGSGNAACHPQEPQCQAKPPGVGCSGTWLRECPRLLQSMGHRYTASAPKVQADPGQQLPPPSVDLPTEYLEVAQSPPDPAAWDRAAGLSKGKRRLLTLCHH